MSPACVPKCAAFEECPECYFAGSDKERDRVATVEAAVLEAYGLLEGASTYGYRQAVEEAMKVLLPLVAPSATADKCVWCGATGYGKECPPCEVKHEGQPFPTEAGGEPQ